MKIQRHENDSCIPRVKLSLSHSRLKTIQVFFFRLRNEKYAISEISED